MRPVRVITPLWRHARHIRQIAQRPRDHGPFPLRDARVLISGGSHGIGKALVERLLAEGACVVSIDPAPPAVKHPQFEAIAGDVRTFDFSPLEPFDLIVANAGVVDSSPTGQLDDDGIHRLVSINVVGLIRTLDAPKTANARALVISSRSAVRAETPGIVYGATKAAALNYAFTFGLRYPTTVAVIGLTRTSLFDAEADYHGLPAPEFIADLRDPDTVARHLTDAVAAGLECVLTDRDTLRDVAHFSHWLATATLLDDGEHHRPRH
ncbi:MAG: SDR family oxidoreductase [Actinobacteria bacterium]|nr:SDR family oxidoreductase [Actinomycetota bacterium]